MTYSANYDMVKTLDGAKALADMLMSKDKIVSFDVETGYSGPDTEGGSLNVYKPEQFVVGFSITNDVRWSRYIPLFHDFGDNLDPEKVWEIFKPVLEEKEIVAHNWFFEARNMLALDRKGHGPKIVMDPNKFHDTMLQSYVLSETVYHGLKGLTKTMYDYDQVEIHTLFGDKEKMTKRDKDCIRYNVLPLSPEVINYVCDDTSWTLRLHQDRVQKVLAERRFIYDLEREIMSVLVDMTEVGVSVDWEGIKENEAVFERFYQNMEDRTRELFEESAGRDLTTLNFRSSAQMRELLFTDLGLTPTRKTKKTDKGGGQASTAEVALEGLRKQHPAVEQLLMYRQTKKMGEWFQNWSQLEKTAFDGKVHPNLNQVRIQSGRFASSEPNVQNIRKDWFFTTVQRDEQEYPKDEDGEKAFQAYIKENYRSGEDYWSGNAREYLIASPGYTILTFDYSQQELRVLAGLAKEPYLIDAFGKGIDIHKATAAMMFNVDVDKVTKDMRQKAKTINFGLIYGQQAKALGESLDISQEEAQRLIDLYFSSFSKVDEWFAKVKAEGHSRKAVYSFMGRKSKIWELESEFRTVRSKADRLFVNIAVQGGGADITKVAMVRAKRELVKRGWWMTKVRMLMNQHDSLVFEVSDDLDLQEVQKILQPQVSYPVEGFPEFAVDWEHGQSWGAPTSWSKGTNLKPVEKPKENAPLLETTKEIRIVLKFAQMPTKAQVESVMGCIGDNPGESAVVLNVNGQVVATNKSADAGSFLKYDLHQSVGDAVSLELEEVADED